MKHVLQILCVGLLWCVTQVYALGLGDLEVDSALNEPLVASIALYGAESINEGDLLVKIASAADFERAGISRDFVLTTLKFEVVLGEQPHIQIRTEAAIKEPFLNFLLDVQSPKAQFLKEYTAFLDPVE